MRRLARLTAIIACFATLAPAPVAAESDGSSDEEQTSEPDAEKKLPAAVRMLSSDNQIVGSADWAAFRATSYHQRLIEWTESRTGNEDLSQVMTEKLGFNPDETLEQITFGVPSGQMGTTPRDLETFTVILDGSFDNDKVLEEIKEREGDDLTRLERPGDWPVYQVRDIEVGFTGDGQLTVVRGSKSYAQTAWRGAAGDGPFAADKIASYNGFAPVDRSGLAWLIKRSSGDRSPQSENLVQTAASFGLKGKFTLQVVTIAKDESGAKQTAQRFSSVSNQSGSAQMLSVIGAAPLARNLTVNRRGKIVTARTSMTHDEFDHMLSSIRRMQQQMQQDPERLDIPGKNSESSDDDSGASKDSDASKQSGDDDSDDGGSDFN